MDLVECEAPLDNSFQKDRLELVNKGSLGRRRKPSRSNLRLILSPANDRQVVDVFHIHQHANGGLIHDKVSPTKILRESALDNEQESVTLSHQVKNFTNSGRSASDNYREVVGSIKKICSTNCFDFNGNNQRLVPSRNNREKVSLFNQDDKNRNNKHNSKPDNNNEVNSKHHSQLIELSNGHLPNKSNYRDVSESQTISEYKNHYVKISNGRHSNKSNLCDNNCDFKSQKLSQYKNHGTKLNNGHISNKLSCNGDNDCFTNEKTQKNHQESINNCKFQQTPKVHQNIVTFSNRRQIVTSLPVNVKKPELTNGNHTSSPLDGSCKSVIEPSLPRTSKELSLVEEARQFSVDVKLKRKNSDVQGRSAVLIRTWERRTQSESNSKSKNAPKNPFSDKEISNTNSIAMPDSYICSKYKGSLQNGDSLQKGEFVSDVRDLRPDENMVYRVPEERQRRTNLSNNSDGEVVVNGYSSAGEPEWISLSRKLCAKFVEGHIESSSPDSFPYEEPEGVGENLTSSPESKKSHSGSTSSTTEKEIQKKKINSTASPSEETVTNNEPPWIHLSRKLCTKFIEEHIEYPPISNGHIIEVPELVEPNGDIRIIEKIGKPKGHKSKQKKEYEPEWVSLSKKLRAKFIESHIDDPDTIALDNQLNASDPEETASESLSDISQDTPLPSEIVDRSTPIDCYNKTVRSQVIQDASNLKQNGTRKEEANFEKQEESIMFPEKECCWEYQEMEFDQESNSGNFQEQQYDDQFSGEDKMAAGTFPQEYSNKCEERVTFSNSFFAENYECINNDVRFAPRSDNDEAVSRNPEQNKLITVQFIAHAKKEQDNMKRDETSPPCYIQSEKK